MTEVLTESACKILLRLAGDLSLVIVKPVRQGFWSIMPVDIARQVVDTGDTEKRIGQKFQSRVVDRLFYAGFLKPGPFEQACELTERGKLAAKALSNETRHPTAGEMIARRSVNARA